MTAFVEKMDGIPTVQKAELVEHARGIKQRGLRFVMLTAVEREGDAVDIIYHYGDDLKMEHFRLTVPKSEPVPSISGVYFAALLVENEIQDQFGVRFEGLALDYNRTLLLDGDVKEIPFTNKQKIPPARS